MNHTPSRKKGEPHTERCRRQLTFETLASRLVLSTVGFSAAPPEHDVQVMAHYDSMRDAAPARFDNHAFAITAGRDGRGQRFGAADGGRGTFDPALGGALRRADGFRGDGGSSWQQGFSVIETAQVYIPLQVVFFVNLPVESTAVSPLVSSELASSTSYAERPQGLLPMAHAAAERAESTTAGPAPNEALTFSVSAALPARAETPAAQPGQRLPAGLANLASLAWVLTTPAPSSSSGEVTQRTDTLSVPDSSTRADSSTEGGLVELESPSARDGGTAADGFSREAWQRAISPQLDNEAALEWLWSTMDEFTVDELGVEDPTDAVAADDENAEDEQDADATDLTAAATEPARSSAELDAEGGLIELLAADPHAAVPYRSYVDHDAEALADAQVRLEAGVALVRVFDLGTGPAADVPAEAAAPAELPAAESASTDQPVETAKRIATDSAGLLLVVPLVLRRRKRDEETEERRRR